MKELRHVVIIGGGIAGLAAAHRLLELSAERQFPLGVTLVERSNRLGGPIATEREGGFVMEGGADSFISEKPWALALASRLGLENQLIPTGEFRTTMVVCRGRLMEIPRGFTMLAPSALMPMLQSPILSLRGKLRLVLEPILPARRGADDESLSSFVTRRMGREVLERLAQPLAAGIYTGDPAALSLEATMPRFAELEYHYGSVIRGLKASQRFQSTSRASGARWSLFLSFAEGMQTLVDALAARLAGTIRFGAGVRSLQPPAADSKWRVALHDGTVAVADAVICAVRACDAAQLIAPFDNELGRDLGRIDYSSAAIVNLAYRESDFSQMPRCFGFIVPAVERRRILACSFSSLKFARRAPAGHVLLRVFMGGALQRELMALSDEEMVAAARADIAGLLGVSAAPMIAKVTRWVESMPQYAVGHLALISAIEARIKAIPGLALAGAAYRGVGIPDCVHSGETAAESTLSYVESAISQSAA